jgi:hypothetical protein
LAINAEVSDLYVFQNKLPPYQMPYKYGKFWRGSEFRLGIKEMALDDNDNIKLFEKRISFNKSINYLSAYASTLANIKSKIPQKYINETTCDELACIILSHPDINYKVTFKYYNPPKKVAYLEDIIFEMK